jgi:chromosome partitioning protein
MAKGGVGKSNCSVNLCAALSNSGKKVLLVDMDPQQGNATLSLGHTPSQLKSTIANVISACMDQQSDLGLADTLLTVSENFYLLPANPRLEAVQNRLIAEHSNAGMFTEEISVQSHCALKHILSHIRKDMITLLSTVRQASPC